MSCTWSSYSSRSLKVMLCGHYFPQSSRVGYSSYICLSTLELQALLQYISHCFSKTSDLKQKPGTCPASILGSPGSPLSLEFHSRCCSLLHQQDLALTSQGHSWIIECWQCPLPIPWQPVPLQCSMESPSPQGCGTEERGAEARSPGAARGLG